MIDNIKILLYAIFCALKITAEIFGYWLMLVLFCEDLTDVVAIGALFGSVVMAIVNRIIIHWAE